MAGKVVCCGTEVEMGPFKSPPVKLEETSWGTLAGYLYPTSRTGTCVHCGTVTKEEIPFSRNNLGL